MVDIAVIHLLRDARTAGFQVDLNDDKLSVTGPRDRGDILSGIRDHKTEIIDALQNPSSAAQHYVDRLTSGAAWLEACEAKMDAAETDRRDSWAMAEAYVRNLHLWADLDEELRRIVPEYRGCPIGGCKETAAVRCLHCAPSATTGAES
jgi:hypothetical protein